MEADGPVNLEIAHGPCFSRHARCWPQQRYALGRSFPNVFWAPWEDEISFWSFRCAPGTRHTHLIYSSCQPCRVAHSIDKTGHPASGYHSRSAVWPAAVCTSSHGLGSSVRPVQRLSRHPRHCASAADPRKRAGWQGRGPGREWGAGSHSSLWLLGSWGGVAAEMQISPRVGPGQSSSCSQSLTF